MKTKKYLDYKTVQRAGSLLLMLFLLLIATDGNSQSVVSSANTTGKNGSSKIYVYPNPTKDYVTVEFHLPKPAGVVFTVFTATGKMIYQSKAMLKAGLQTQTFNLMKYPAGEYIIVIDAGYQQYKAKVLKL